MFNGLVINPAYAGSRNMLTAQVNYRNQWTGFNGAPQTSTLTVHSPIMKRKLGIGFMLMHDKIGVSRETSATANIAYRLKTKNGALRFGIGGGVSMLSAKWSDVDLQNQNDQVYLNDTQNEFRPNFSAGIYYKNKHWYAGASVPFLMSSQLNPENDGFDMNFDPSQSNYLISGGGIIKLNKDLLLKPSTLLRFNPSSGLQADINANLVLKSAFWFGFSYRIQDAVVGMFEYQVTDQWRLGYSYDMGLSDLRTHHGGTHEVMLQYEFSFRTSSTNPRYF